jgi:hypothetical protein
MVPLSKVVRAILQRAIFFSLKKKLIEVARGLIIFFHYVTAVPCMQNALRDLKK